MNGIVAAIDCGTNSTRLLIASLGEDGLLVTHERLMHITRLGQGVDATGRLDPAAIDRTVQVLRGYREVMDRFEVGEVRMTATSAARDAANGGEFFDAAEQAVGRRPELISGHEEASLSFRGATSDLDPALGPFLVVDIGGGSTEFAIGTDRTEGAISIDVGCVRMTEKYLHHDPPQPDELSACLSIIEAYVKDVERELPGIEHLRTFVGLAGTVSTAASLDLGLAAYDRDRVHHHTLPKGAVEELFRELATETVEQRQDEPGMDPGRADVMVGGLCVLVQIMRQLGLAECLVSEADILDGLALSLLAPE